MKKEIVSQKKKKEVVNFEFVDLGLSVKWANMNVGSSKKEEFGRYFSCNEVMGEEEVDWVEYCNDVDVDMIGGSKMPSEEEIDELLNQCKWEWKEVNGVKGYKVSSKVNRNWIFLPAGGCMNGDGEVIVGFGGYYLSGTKSNGKLKGLIEIVFNKSKKGKDLAGPQYKRLIRLVK